MKTMDKIMLTVGVLGVGLNVFNFSRCSQYDETGLLSCMVGIVCGAFCILSTNLMRQLFAASFRCLAVSLAPREPHD